MNAVTRVPLQVGFAAALVLGAGPLQAALPPQHERAREFTAVIEEATRRLGTRPIDAVERLADTEYRVRAGPCVIEIRIVGSADAGSAPGPRRLSVVAGEPRCR